MGDSSEPLARVGPTSSEGRKKWNGPRTKPLHYGSKGGRNKTRDMEHQQRSRTESDKRDRDRGEQAKRRKIDAEDSKKAYLPEPFKEEEIEAEERRPKRKVAVMIGYAGSGYRGMQINASEKTIEGDLFAAFVKAGAISKANANDPKKSTLVRCARTDKGVHAAGNVISLKLIVEDEDIVDKINEHLPPQIRIWGIERTLGSFNCYQACNSRWYEYMIPSHCFLPPHPNSFLGRKLVDLAAEVDDLAGYNDRQKETANFWETVEADHINPILESLDDDIQGLVKSALYDHEGLEVTKGNEEGLENAADDQVAEDSSKSLNGDEAFEKTAEKLSVQGTRHELNNRQKQALGAAIKALKAAYLSAKRLYRIPPARLSRIRDVIKLYLGTHNFHNYTVQKTARDPSAKRHIIAFTVSDPIIINGTEWLSLKVHGQSFMMHQIRKMVAMAAMVVRCGCTLERIRESYRDPKVNIPKAPGLGLWLERPVFHSYNEKVDKNFQDRKPIDFRNYETQIAEFKEREIYQRIFTEEDKAGVFHSFFSQLDNYKDPSLLYVTSKGIAATGDENGLTTGQGQVGKAAILGSDSESDIEDDVQEG